MQDEILIECVSCHTILYDTNHKGNKIMNVRENIWREISDTIGTEVVNNF